MFKLMKQIQCFVEQTASYNQDLEQILHEIDDVSANKPEYWAPYSASMFWNNELKPYRDEQSSYLGIADASDAQHKTIRKVNQFLRENHDQIAEEVLAVLENGYRGLPITNFDKAHASLLEGDEHWTGIWVKFLNTWAATAPLLPTLMRLAEDIEDELFLMKVSIFWPGTEVPPHTGVSMGVLRYHYGLVVPDGDMGLTLYNDTDGYDKPLLTYRWYEKEGILWDDTIKHSAFSYASQPRIVVLADVYRELPEPLDTLNKAVHKHLTTFPHIQRIADVLFIEGREYIADRAAAAAVGAIDGASSFLSA